MKRRLWVLTVMLLLLAACGQAEAGLPMKETEETDEYAALVATTPVAGIEGEAVSPGGRFEVRAEGASGEYVSGIQPPEFLQIVDRETGEVLWQDHGWLSQSVLWSPEGGFLAQARTARTWCSIIVIETENWTEWEFTLPDGSPIPEYTFLPDDEPWCVWREYEGCFDLTLGRGGDGEPKIRYYCVAGSTNGTIEGCSWEEDRVALSGDYDFDHDGTPETVELVTIFGENGVSVGGYTLRIWKEGGTPIWVQNSDLGHASWCSVFAFEQDGRDYLFRYNPTMYQGFATYSYTLFSLSETGEEQVVREGSVNFDQNFGAPMHESYDPEAITAFLEEVHGLLEDSELLLTTESGEFRSGGPGAGFKDDLSHWTDSGLYDESKSLEDNIRSIGAYWKKRQAS